MKYHHLSNVFIHIVNSISNQDIDSIVEMYVEGSFDNELTLLGEGGYGKVYSYKKYAIKTIIGDKPFSSNDVSVMLDINHLSCLPKLYAILDDHTLIMERIHGTTIKKYTESLCNPFNIDESILDQWDNALTDIISEGYSPEDLHKENVMINQYGDIKIIDVGLFEKIDPECSLNDYMEDRSFMCAQSTSYVLRDYLDRLEIKKNFNIET